MTSTATQIKSLSDQLAVLKVQQAKELAGDKPDLPRLEDITTDYLDTIAKRLRTDTFDETAKTYHCLLYTSPSPRDRQKSRMPSSA